MPRKYRAARILPLHGEKILRVGQNHPAAHAAPALPRKNENYCGKNRYASQPYEAVRFGKVRS